MDLEDITAEMSRSLDALKIIYEKLEIELGEKSCFMQNAEQRELLYTLYALSHITVSYTHLTLPTILRV